MLLKINIERIWAPTAFLKQANALRALLFAYVLFYTAQLILAKDILFEPSSSLLLSGRIQDLSVTYLVNLLSVEGFKEYYWVFMGLQVIFATVGLLGFLPRLSSFVVFFTLINLQNRIYAGSSSGDMLVYILLFYLSFISEKAVFKNPHLNQLQNAFNRVFIFLCYFQVILIYAVSAIYKLMSPEWVSGDALFYTLSINEYSLLFIQNHLQALQPFLKIATWLTLLYQLLFPFMVFSKWGKNTFLGAGVIIHLCIAFAMGLFNFSLVMICCYVLFIDFHRKKA